MTQSVSALFSCSPQPEELRQNRPDEPIDEDVGPDQLAGELEGLKAGVVEQEETGPEQQKVEQTHKPWKQKQNDLVTQVSKRRRSVNKKSRRKTDWNSFKKESWVNADRELKVHEKDSKVAKS